ncbi:hypothetical protein DFH08DRAFT_900636 [Mycena albidolilacea]|uniref:Uncharacterized protein n=1 Tax=Mycena albidolilacea TaxID=1033008 RepID=A0AAD7EAL5_9AGAR|nr:hypothetical protein DFH08DRAFT_900636 [Mycena albidolilacea]
MARETGWAYKTAHHRPMRSLLLAGWALDAVRAIGLYAAKLDGDLVGEKKLVHGDQRQNTEKPEFLLVSLQLLDSDRGLWELAKSDGHGSGMI